MVICAFENPPSIPLAFLTTYFDGNFFLERDISMIFCEHKEITLLLAAIRYIKTRSKVDK
jgi:hypothetical protein